MEALAHGVPAIGCAGESGPDEIAELSGGMLLVPPRDPPSPWPGAIERALADGSLPARARAAAAHFTWERCGQATVAAYEAALER